MFTMSGLQRTPGHGTEHVRQNANPRIPDWLRLILGIPLEMKLLGANLIILGVAVLVLFGPIRLHPGRLTDVYVVVAALHNRRSREFCVGEARASPRSTLSSVLRGGFPRVDLPRESRPPSWPTPS